MTTTLSLTFPVPAAALYDFLADPRTRPEWQSSLRRVDPITELAPHVGSEWYDVTWPGLRPHMWISRAEAPTIWAEEGTWHGVRAALELRFHAEGRRSTRLEVAIDVWGEGLWRYAARVAGLGAPLAAKADLTKAAEIVALRTT